jgi:hypothetical protein
VSLVRRLLVEAGFKPLRAEAQARRVALSQWVAPCSDKLKDAMLTEAQ